MRGFNFIASESQKTEVSQIFCLMEVRAMVVAWLYNSPQRNASLALPRALSNTAHLPVQRQHTKPAQLNSGTDTKMC